MYRPLMESMGGVILSRLGGSVNDPGSLPVDARIAVAQQRTSRGVSPVIEAVNARDPAAIAAAVETSRPLLQDAIPINESLIGEGEPAAAQAVGKAGLAMVRWALNPRDGKTVYDSGRALFEVARDHPDQPVAEQAMRDGIVMLREQASAKDAPQEARATYAEAAALMQDKYASLPETVDEREEYAERVLIGEKGDFKGAADLYDRTPQSHPLYFRHRLLQLLALMEWVDKGSTPQEQPIHRNIAADEAREVLRDAQAVINNADAKKDTQGDAVRAAIEAYLTLAQVAMENKTGLPGDSPREAVGYLGEAMGLLDRHEVEMEKDLRLWVNSLQVQALVADRQLDAAAQLVQRLMDEDGKQAKPLVQNLLAVFGDEITAKREAIDRGGVAPSTVDQYRQDIEAAASTASTLASQLDTWGKAQNLPPDEMLPVQLMLIKADRLSGKLQQALDLSKHLYENPQFASQRGVVVERAETLFAQATQGDTPTPTCSTRRWRCTAPSSINPTAPRRSGTTTGWGSFVCCRSASCGATRATRSVWRWSASSPRTRASAAAATPSSSPPSPTATPSR